MSKSKYNLLGRHILVVDDCEELREDLKSILDAKNAIVDVACDGAEAISMTQQNPYDVIIMDVNMPGLDGIQTAKKILEAKKNKIIFLTGYDNSKKLQGESGFFDDLLFKPVDTATLFKSIEKALA